MATMTPDPAINALVERAVTLVKERIGEVRRAQGYGKIEVSLDTMTPVALLTLTTRSDVETRPLPGLPSDILRKVLRDLADGVAFTLLNPASKGHVTINCAPKRVGVQTVNTTEYEF